MPCVNVAGLFKGRPIAATALHMRARTDGPDELDLDAQVLQLLPRHQHHLHHAAHALQMDSEMGGFVKQAGT